jgi:hypothetical protein
MLTSEAMPPTPAGLIVATPPLLSAFEDMLFDSYICVMCIENNIVLLLLTVLWKKLKTEYYVYHEWHQISKETVQPR